MREAGSRSGIAPIWIRSRHNCERAIRFSCRENLVSRQCKWSRQERDSASRVGWIEPVATVRKPCSLQQRSGGGIIGNSSKRLVGCKRDVLATASPSICQ